jgi:hypothetical protein
MADNQFWRIAAGRVAFSLGRAPADSYRSMCRAVAAKFGLSAKPGLVSNGYDIVFQDYERGASVVGLKWDNWMGFTVVAQSTESEPLVQEIGDWLLESTWATEGITGEPDAAADGGA